MVKRTRLNITLYVNWLSCVSLVYGVLFVMFVAVMWCVYKTWMLLKGSVLYMTQPEFGENTRLALRDEWKCKADVWKNLVIYSPVFAAAPLFEFWTDFMHLSQYFTNFMHKICFTISFFFSMPLHVSSTCAHHQEVKIPLHYLWFHQTYRCDNTRGCVMEFWPPDDEHMCSKHVKGWNKTYCETNFMHQVG